MPALANMAKGSIGQAILCEPSQWIVGMASLHAKLIKHHRWHDVDQGIDRHPELAWHRIDRFSDVRPVDYEQRLYEIARMEYSFPDESPDGFGPP